MKSFKSHISERNLIKSLVDKLKKDKKVVNLIKRNANLTAVKLGVALLTLPVVNALFNNLDKLQNATILANTLKTVILGEEMKSFKQYITKQPSYEFKNSSIHGMGTFANKDIKMGERVSLYYYNLLRENKNIPEYQRTDFCRFTNHSRYKPNVELKENNDGNFYAIAIKNITKGGEALIDYFKVFEVTIPALKNNGKVISEVLRTKGYENLEIPPDTFNDIRDELSYFLKINE